MSDGQIDCGYCTAAEAIKAVWQSVPDLHHHIPATHGDENRVFTEGRVPPHATDVYLPYCVISELGIRSATATSDSTFLDVRTYAVKIYSNSRRLNVELSRLFRDAVGKAHCMDTCQGRVCRLSLIHI